MIKAAIEKIQQLCEPNVVELDGHYYLVSGDKILNKELSCKSDVFFLCKFILKGNVEAVGKLRFLSFLCFLNCVP